MSARKPTREQSLSVLSRCTKKTYLAKGKRGIAYTAELDGEVVLLKEPNPTADVNTIAHEADMLNAVNKVSIGPTFIALENGTLIREFIDGEEMPKWLETATKKDAKQALLAVLDQCRALDKIGINKLEMTHPTKHVLIRKPSVKRHSSAASAHSRSSSSSNASSFDVVMIDFDRSRRTIQPKNVTQVCQWFTSGAMTPLLAKKNILFSREEFSLLMKSYKVTMNERTFEKIRQVVRDA